MSRTLIPFKGPLLVDSLEKDDLDLNRLGWDKINFLDIVNAFNIVKIVVHAI
jgi:hypothetical protein